MNNYRVRITARTETEARMIDTIHDTVLSDGERGKICLETFTCIYIGGNSYMEKVVYSTDNEDVALSIYARAKRNLDMARFMVTLELPAMEGKE
ncbi:MAG: hypothetical protein NC324_02650 [Bacteroides sp.]|nr:hypothetical protein [Bacteroides sp.]